MSRLLVHERIPDRHQEVAGEASLDGRRAVEGRHAQRPQQRRDFGGGIGKSIVQPAVVPVERRRQVQEEVAGAFPSAAVARHERGQPDQRGQGVCRFQDVGGLLVAEPVGDAALLHRDEGAEVVAARHRLEAGLRADHAMGLIN